MLRTSVLATALLALAAFPACSKQTEAAGNQGTVLGLSDPFDQTITQGESNDISISIDRKGFADAVTVDFSNLPSGVRVEGGTSIPAGESKHTFKLIAAPDARPVEKHLVTVTARGKGATPTQTFELTVKPRG